VRRGRGKGGHGGPGHAETALTGDTKGNVETAVLAKYSSAGKELEVLVSKDFKVLDAREHPDRRCGPPREARRRKPAARGSGTARSAPNSRRYPRDLRHVPRRNARVLRARRADGAFFASQSDD
jgi:hypothetical protein